MGTLTLKSSNKFNQSYDNLRQLVRGIEITQTPDVQQIKKQTPHFPIIFSVWSLPLLLLFVIDWFSLQRQCHLSHYITTYTYHNRKLICLIVNYRIVTIELEAFCKQYSCFSIALVIQKI